MAGLGLGSLPARLRRGWVMIVRSDISDPGLLGSARDATVESVLSPEDQP
jgi:hypothetical protein